MCTVVPCPKGLETLKPPLNTSEQSLQYFIILVLPGLAPRKCIAFGQRVQVAEVSQQAAFKFILSMITRV